LKKVSIERQKKFVRVKDLKPGSPGAVCSPGLQPRGNGVLGDLEFIPNNLLMAFEN
jgi:hypothetical protein